MSLRNVMSFCSRGTKPLKKSIWKREKVADCYFRSPLCLVCCSALSVTTDHIGTSAGGGAEQGTHCSSFGWCSCWVNQLCISLSLSPVFTHKHTSNSWCLVGRNAVFCRGWEHWPEDGWGREASVVKHCVRLILVCWISFRLLNMFKVQNAFEMFSHIFFNVEKT